jgi:hypothetical protein
MVPVDGLVAIGVAGADTTGTDGTTAVISFAGAFGVPDGGVTASAAERATVADWVTDEFVKAVCCGVFTTKADGISADSVPRT